MEKIDDQLIAQDRDFDKLILIGSNWHLCSNAFESLATTALSIDMAKSQFAADALVHGEVTQLYIKNIINAITSEYGNPALTLSGFMANSFSRAKIWTLTFSDISLTDLTSTYFPASTLETIGIQYSMYIQGNDGKIFFDGKDYIDDINNKYFEFTAENWISSINFSAFNNIEPMDMLTIPYGTAGICADVFNRINLSSTAVERAFSTVDTIYIPNTVKAINESAFYMLD